MRRILSALLVGVIVGFGAFAAGGCSGSGSGTTDASTPAGSVDPATNPVGGARSVVDAQNDQLDRMEQQTGQADPTAP